MNIKDIISKWQERLGMQEFNISVEEIQREQVVYPDDITKEERYFVGIDRKTCIINHDRELTEEDIVHEMFHLGFPDSSEEFVILATKQLMDNFDDTEW